MQIRVAIFATFMAIHAELGHAGVQKFFGKRCVFTVTVLDTKELKSIDSEPFTAFCRFPEEARRFMFWECTFVAPGTNNVTKSMTLSMPNGKEGALQLTDSVGAEIIRFQGGAFLSDTIVDIQGGKILGHKQCVGTAD
jgi:hypothetical protein